jgi:TolB protein
MKKIFFLLGFIWISFSYGEVELDINQGQVKPFPLSVLSFQGNSKIAAEVRSVLVADLERSGFVEVLDPNSYMQSQLSLQELPRFQDWKLINRC